MEALKAYTSVFRDARQVMVCGIMKGCHHGPLGAAFGALVAPGTWQKNQALVVRSFGTDL
jgi:hypothetical protein